MEVFAESSVKTSESKEHLVGLPSSTHLRPTPVTVSGVSVVSTVWLVVTFLIIAALVIAAGWPNWMKNHDPDQLGNQVDKVDIGLFYVCYELPDTDPDVYCDTDMATTFDDACCSPYLDFVVPSNLSIGNVRLNDAELDDISYLFASSIIYAVAVAVMIASLVFGVIAYRKPRVYKSRCSVFAVAFVLQVTASTMLVVALLLFPASFESDFLQQFCGSRASYYYRGQCSLDWSLFVAMVATSCSFYLPSLAIFAMNIADGYQAQICC